MKQITSLRLVAIDDNEDHIFILERLLQRAGVPPPLPALHSGEQGVAWLAAQVERGPEEVPDVVFIDLDMPGMTGLDVVCWIRSRKAFANTAVIMLSSSENPTAVRQAYALGAQCYLVKHPSAEELAQLLCNARRFAAEPASSPLLFHGPYHRLMETAGTRTIGFDHADE